MHKDILVCFIRAGPGCLPKFQDVKTLFDMLQTEFEICGVNASDSAIADSVDSYRIAERAHPFGLERKLCLGIQYRLTESNVTRRARSLTTLTSHPSIFSIEEHKSEAFALTQLICI